MSEPVTLKAALAYARRGWSVFPLKAREKTPITTNGVKDATTDEAQIREWWRAHPTANVGIATGRSGLVVIDVDGEEGEESWRSWQRENGIVGPTVVARTGSGGRHFVFEAPTGVELAPGQGILGPGSHVDVRAGESYIVAPGSTHPSGDMYLWDEAGNPNEIAPAALPNALRELLTSPKPATQVERNGDPDDVDLISSGQDEYGARRAAVLASKGFSKDEARAALEAMIEYRFEGGWRGLDPRRPWEPKDIERWIRGAYEKFYDKDGDAAPEDYLDGLVAPRETAPDAPAEAQWPEYRGDDLAARDDVQLDYLPVLGEPGWLVKGWSHLLSGFVRAGKTEFLIRSVRQWVDEGLVVYWLSEEGLQVWTLRLRGKPGAWHRLIVLPAMGMPVREMAQRAFKSEADVVIVDSIRNLLQIKDENDNAEMAAAVRPWVNAGRETGKTLILTHHSRKGGGEHGEGVSGGHGLISVIDVILEVKRDGTADNRRVLSTLARVIVPKRETYELDAETGGMRFVEAISKRDEVKSRILAVIEKAEGALTKKEIAERMIDAPRDSYMGEMLKELAESGRIVAVPGAGRTPATYAPAIAGLLPSAGENPSVEA